MRTDVDALESRDSLGIPTDQNLLGVSTSRSVSDVCELHIHGCDVPVVQSLGMLVLCMRMRPSLAKLLVFTAPLHVSLEGPLAYSPCGQKWSEVRRVATVPVHIPGTAATASRSLQTFQAT